MNVNIILILILILFIRKVRSLQMSEVQLHPEELFISRPSQFAIKDHNVGRIMADYVPDCTYSIDASAMVFAKSY